MSNMLRYETSPYLRQHAENPVDWYPWCEEAFSRAKNEDKPVFLSIGYSTCHWCHVMARESFEDAEVAELLNRYFIAVKVDREERPDIDNIYMRACQAFTGGGGWPTSIFMTSERKPFYAGTYYPKHSRRGMIGLIELLQFIHDQWDTDRAALMERADEIVAYLLQSAAEKSEPDTNLPEKAISLFIRTHDRENGGFGSAPKFPMPHNLIFLLNCYQLSGRTECLEMADRTLMQMYRGGIYDHIGGGFSRYSTDARFLVPHFEKMLYDNALLILAYCKAHAVIEDKKKATLYLQVAEKTADFVLREMTSPEGGFYSAQDADSEGEEGKYYVFTPQEIKNIVAPEHYEIFCRHYGISERGNFNGAGILNLLHSDPFGENFNADIDALYRYRKNRHTLHTDDKILTAWNGLMIAAMCALYNESGNKRYLSAAENADRFIRDKLTEGDRLYAGCAAGRRGVCAFLDDYAAYCFAQLALYRVTLKNEYLNAAQELCRSALNRFFDEDNGGFFFSENGNDALIMRTKEVYDGALPSGNSLMAWNLVKLRQLTDDGMYQVLTDRQLNFLSAEASAYPAGYTMFLCALLEYENPAARAVIVSDEKEINSELLKAFPMEASLVLQPPSDEYPLVNGKTTFYICAGRKCYPPVHDPHEAARF